MERRQGLNRPGSGLFIALLALLVSECVSAEGNLSGWWFFRGGYGIHEDHHSDVLNEQLLQLEWKDNDLAGFQVDVKLWAQRESALEPDVFHDVRLRELAITKQADEYSLSLGRQIVVWGKADGFHLLDLVNPFDLREFVLGDDLRERLPIWMVNLQLFPSDDDQWQFLFIPQTYHDRLPDEGAEFDPYADLRRPGVDLQSVQVPSDEPENWSFGARWTRSFGAADVSLIALHNLNGTPVLFTSVNPDGTLVIRREIVKRTIIGLAADWNVGQAVLRAEVAVSPDEYRIFYDPNGIPYEEKHTALRTLIGVDWNINNWLISPQIFHVEAPGSPGVGNEPEGTYASLLLERKFHFDKLTFRFFGTSATTFDDNWINASLAYQLKDNLEVSIGADWLGGKSSGFFGQFSDRDRLVIGLKGYF